MSDAPAKPAAKAKRCARCGAGFLCGVERGASACWCEALPPLAPTPGEGCLCPSCLAAAVAAQAMARGATADRRST